jgi:hypothetical protein
MNAIRNSAVTTIIEYATLAGWLLLVLAGQPVLAIAILAGGLLLEHIAALVLKGISPVLVRAAMLGLLETVVWAVWLVLTESQPVAAVIVLFTGLLAGHILERNILNGLPLHSLANVSRLLDFTALETIAGVVWLSVGGIVGNVVLLAGLFVEHLVSLLRLRAAREARRAEL